MRSRRSPMGDNSVEEDTNMPHLGPLELGIILVIVIMVFGVGKLPEVGSAVGKAIRDFRRASAGVEEELKRDVEELPKGSA